MAQFKNNLDSVRVASPCPADWDNMLGDDRVRFCGQCQLNVYNLSEMSRSEAELLIARTEGRLCIRYYQRRDGSIITRNCPVGLRAIKRRLTRVASAVASAVLSFLAGLGAYSIADRLSLVGSKANWTTGEMVVPMEVIEVQGVLGVAHSYPAVTVGQYLKPLPGRRAQKSKSRQR